MAAQPEQVRMNQDEAFSEAGHEFQPPLVIFVGDQGGKVQHLV